MWTRLRLEIRPPGNAEPLIRAGHTLSILKKQNGNGSSPAMPTCWSRFPFTVDTAGVAWLAFNHQMRSLTKYLPILLMALPAGCSKQEPSNQTTTTKVPIPADSPRHYPTLVLDAEHNKLIEQQTNAAVEAGGSRDIPALTSTNWLQITDTNKSTTYQISAAQGVWLDGSNYHFTEGTNAQVPNMVEMVMGKSVYKLYWPVERTNYVINSISMETTEGEPFRGFHPGDQANIAIGRCVEGPEKTNFWVSWAGQIDVK
jgi:hypothetical protein